LSRAEEMKKGKSEIKQSEADNEDERKENRK
jgi:hypothetical protein